MDNLDATTIVFAIVALVVLYKLRSVLGARTGAERRPLDMAPPRPAPTKGGDNVVTLTPKAAAPAIDPATPGAAGLNAIMAREPTFRPADFLQGARAAYEMIVAAFAAGDVATLRNLLAPDVFANFSKAIEARRAALQTMTTTLVSLDAAEIVGAEVVGSVASVSVRFAAKMVSATRDAGGGVVEGSDTTVADHLDIWTFTRTLGARDPNWALSATETVH